jgi:hypothetical protein
LSTIAFCGGGGSEFDHRQSLYVLDEVEDIQQYSTTTQ